MTTRPAPAVGLSHGTPSGYQNYGCRCEPCTQAASAARRQWVASLQDRPAADLPHGTSSGYRNWRCRCLPCRRELDEAGRERVRTSEVSAAAAVAAVRSFRARQRKRQGAAPVGPTWEPDYLTAAHPLARRAAAMCEAREHTQRRRIGKTACGQCWETAIRQDEQLVARTLAGADLAGAAVP